MSRNIILCADGTGNKGGYTPDSNVFKTYNAVEINNQTCEQISFYDNGVGTSTNKFLKAISAGLGLGFQRNVRELYAFLCKNYTPEKDANHDSLDRIYLFGFSRGAATIRALNGFINDCGVIDARTCESDLVLRDEIKVLITTYLKARYQTAKNRSNRKAEDLLSNLASGQPINGCERKRHKAKIQFIGVWDTVAALGMPKRTDNTGILSVILNGLFNGIDQLFNSVLHHRNYNFQLTPNITRACHALAIDDERTSFWPRIWNECSSSVQDVSVDQVWFAGMHSDVGGGYNRQAMSDVSLAWILGEAVKQDLTLKCGALQQIKARANVHDKMHDSRDGFGMFYRYHPRHIQSLCMDERDPGKDMLKGDIKIHESVLSRMYYRTAGYAPNLLPDKFDVVNAQGGKVTPVDVSAHQDWQMKSGEAQRYIKWLKELYIVQLAVTFSVIGYSLYLWNGQVEYIERSGFWGHIADVMQYVLPEIFDNFIELWISQNPIGLLLVLAIIGVWLLVRNALRSRLLKRALAKRKIIMDQYP